MGTRHLITVVKDGKNKIAQYGQWDGYPSGQGVTVLQFLKNKRRVAKFRKSLDRVRFLDYEGKDKEMLEEYDKNAPVWSTDEDFRTDKQRAWFRTFMCRDIGAEILGNVANSEGEVVLRDNSDFSKEFDCEYEYKINLDVNQLHVYDDGKKVGVYELDDLPTKKQFLKELKDPYA